MSQQDVRSRAPSLISMDLEAQRKLIWLGVAAGLAAILMYVTRSFLPMPAALRTAFFLLFGPCLVVAFLGFLPFLGRPRLGISALMGVLFGVIAGATNMMFAAVQLNNLHYIRGYMRAEESPEAQEIWRDILSGVFTVQNGLNFTMDFFLDGAGVLLALAMWSHPRFGKIFSLLAILLVGPHLVMKWATFPVPPAEAGLFDAGPLVGVWFTLVTIQIGRHAGKWGREIGGGVSPEPSPNATLG